jgi:hypothetical protein
MTISRTGLVSVMRSTGYYREFFLPLIDFCRDAGRDW